MVKKFLLGFFLFLFVFPLISAPPSTPTIINFDQGYEIVVAPEGFLKQYEDYQLNFFVYNISNGVHIDNSTTDCYFYMANSTGNVLIYQEVTFVLGNEYWKVDIQGGNFSYLEVYPYGIKCESSSLGGTSVGYFEVTGTGYELTPARAGTYSIIFGLLIFIFITIMLGITKLPDGNDTNENGQLMSINNLKYLRGVLLLFEYLLVVGMVYLSSNLSFAYLGEQLFAKVLFTIFTIMSYMILPIIIVWFVWIFAQIIDDKRMRRLIEHGIYEGKGGKW